jgi:hypothetical protein
VHYARIAYNKEAAEVFGKFEGLDPLALPRASMAQPNLSAISGGGSADADAMRRELRRIILEELSAVLAA